MSSLSHFFGDTEWELPLEIEADDGTIWVRDRTTQNTVSLNLDRAHRAKLRAALDELDKQEAA